MKILVLNWRDTHHPQAGGAEISLYEQALYWQKKGAEITWFSSGFPGSANLEEDSEIKIRRFGSLYTVHLLVWIYLLRHRKEKYDIVIDCFHFVPYFAPLYFPKKTKVVALINEIAGKLWFPNIFLPLAVLGYIFEPYFFKLYKKNIFITGSNSTMQDLLKLGLKESQVYIVHHGVSIPDIERNYGKEKKPTVLFLGRISRDKGIIDALKTFKAIYSKDPNTQFWIIGKEEKEKILSELLESHDKDFVSNIKYFGFVDEKKKFELLRKTWFLLHPSHKEGWGLTVIEAASQGTITIGYKVHGLVDSVKNNETGILVSPGDTEKLADEIIRLSKDSNEYKRLAINAVEWSKIFNWEQSGKASWNILNNLL